MNAEEFLRAYREMAKVSLGLSSLPELPSGWRWFIRYPDGGLGEPTAAAGLKTTDQDCFIYVEPDLKPGKLALRISTGVGPAEVVAAVLKANGIQAPRLSPSL